SPPTESRTLSLHDALPICSQKAFMLPPGLAFVGVSEKAWRLAARSDLPKFYLNFAAEKKASVKNQSAFTSAVSLMGGLDESLRRSEEHTSELQSRENLVCR